MEKLPEDFKAKWIAALRSGEYKQGKGGLYDPETNAFCCIGVAGHLCGIDKDVLSGYKIIGSVDHPDVMDAPKVYPKVLAITETYASDVSRTLASMNDKGKSFSEIAAYIEANL